MIDLKESNRSTVYLLPLIGNKLTYEKIKDYYVNTYLNGIEIKSIDIPEYPLYLVLNYEDSEKFNNVEELLISAPYFIGYKDLNEKQIVYGFNMPEESYQNFIKGYYSKFSPKDKDAILQFYNLNFHHPDNLLLLILRKDKVLRHRILKELGCVKKGGCRCVIEPHEEQVKIAGRTTIEYHVDKYPPYTKCIYYKVPVKDGISEDAELDDIPDFNRETYETGD